MRYGGYDFVATADFGLLSAAYQAAVPGSRSGSATSIRLTCLQPQGARSSECGTWVCSWWRWKPPALRHRRRAGRPGAHRSHRLDHIPRAPSFVRRAETTFDDMVKVARRPAHRRRLILCPGPPPLGRTSPGVVALLAPPPVPPVVHLFPPGDGDGGGAGGERRRCGSRRGLRSGRRTCRRWRRSRPPPAGAEGTPVPIQVYDPRRPALRASVADLVLCHMFRLTLACTDRWPSGCVPAGSWRWRR